MATEGGMSAVLIWKLGVMEPDVKLEPPLVLNLCNPVSPVPDTAGIVDSVAIPVGIILG